MTATASKQELASIYDFTVRAQDGSMVRSTITATRSC